MPTGGNRGGLKCPLGASAPYSVADTRARVGAAAQPMHRLDAAAAAEGQRPTSTIPCPQLPSPDSSSCTGSGTGSTPWRTSSAHKTSSKWLFFSPLGSFEALCMSRDERGEGRGTGHRWELVHPSRFSQSRNLHPLDL